MGCQSMTRSAYFATRQEYLLRLLSGLGSAVRSSMVGATLVAAGASMAPAGSDDPARITLTGVRVTQGDAVDCPQIRDDAGAVHPVSYLSPRVAIGARVEVSGFYAVTTKCRGTVLVVEEELLR